jgi:trimeric autotransporter adhesin
MISFSSRAVPGDEHWDVQFGWPGPSGNVASIATQNGDIYVGTTGSGLTNATLRLWDGWQWSSFAQFYGASSGTIIYDLAFAGNALYAAGSFTNVNGVVANGLAKWDGTSWGGVGNFAGLVTGLTVDGGNLYASGIFTNPAAGGVIATNIAYWDGSAWHALGNGLGIVSGNGYGVHSTLVQNGLVYAAGLFTNSGPQSITNVAVWDGNTWSALGGGVNNLAEAMVMEGSDLYVCGAFTQAGGTAASLVARWDGANWFALGGGLSGSIVYSVASLNGSLYAAGIFTTAGGVHATNVAVWNGSTWAPLGAGISANGTRVFATGTNVFVGGNFLAAGNKIANTLASWDGVEWNTIGTPGRLNGASSTVRAFAGDGTNVYAGGNFTLVGQTNASMVARFDGTSWSPLGSGVGVANLPVVNALAMGTNGDVYAGGSFTFAGNVSTINIAHWDGANWSALGNGPGGVVASITVRTDGVYAAGAPQSGSSYGSPFLMRWDGASWQSVLNYNSDDTFIQFLITDSSIGMDAVAFQDTNIYVGGHFNITWHDPSLTLFTNCPNIMRFDGTYARVVGTGLNSNVVAMTVLGTNLYVAGLFTNAGGVTASHIAMWDGNTWWPVGAGVVGNGTVDALTTIGTNLYAGGTFTNMGGVPASRIAMWDGNAWSALGSGVSATVLGLYSSGSDLYAGGSLRAAGNLPSQFVARWNDQLSFKTPALSNSVWLGKGQFRTRLYGVSGTTNVIEATTDFNSWTPILTNSVGIYDVTDTSAGNYPARFYRARLVP